MVSCEMFKMFQFSGTLAPWKINYCTSNYQTCARYKRACEDGDVPANMMPNGTLLRKAGK